MGLMDSTKFFNPTVQPIPHDGISERVFRLATEMIKVDAML